VYGAGDGVSLSTARASTRFSNDLRYRDEAGPRQVQLTPRYILRPVREALGGAIDLDPCTLADNPTEAARFYYPPMDGATLSWDAERIFVNPPYGKARERWVRRCIALIGWNANAAPLFEVGLIVQRRGLLPA
jgi:hypothetical protein